VPLVVPDLVRRRALAAGAAGQRWLAALPERLAAVADRWHLRLDDVLTGGTASLVVAAHDTVEDRPCVLKLPMSFGDEDEAAFARIVLAHRLADGRGCARLLHHDAAVPAMVLERLGPNLAELRMPVPRLLDTITDTLRAFWRPVAADCGLPTGADQAAWLAASIATSWDELGRPCTRTVVDRALEYCAERERAFDASTAVLVHGDAHGWNTLDAGGGTFKFVDPEGLLSTPEHDLSVAMREYNLPLLAGDTRRLVRARAELLASRCGADPDAVWEWGFVERVSTGLGGWRDFGPDEGAPFLEVATRCL
jgi:streptomycin 6-kinase